MLKLQCLAKQTLSPILTLCPDIRLVLLHSVFIFSVVKMGKREVSYNSNWKVDFKWLRSTNDPSKAFCTVYSKSFRIDNGGKSQIEIHGQGMFRIQHVKAQKGQRTFAKSAKEDSLVISEASSSLSMGEQVLRTEII